jgi:hypothetical protein
MLKKIFINLILILLIFSCTDNENGIFYYLENEEEEKDDTLNNEITITHLAIDYNGYIYVTAGTSIYMLTTNWYSINYPAGTGFCSALVIYNNIMYGGFIDGSRGELWATTNFGTNGPIWTELSDSNNLITGKQILRLKIIGSYLVATTYNDGNYNLYYSNDGSTFNYTNLPQQNTEILDIITDGSNYWAVTDDYIYLSAGGINNFSAAYTNPPVTADNYTGIYFSANYGSYYIATDDGQIFQSFDAVTWTPSNTQKVSGTSVTFTLFSEINRNILVGTRGYGYYEMTDGNIGSIDRLDEFTSSDLYEGWVTDFYISGNTCFFLTSGSGLWHNTYTEASGWGEDWYRE